MSATYAVHSWPGLLGGLARVVAPAVFLAVVGGMIADRWWPGVLFLVVGGAMAWSSLRAAWTRLAVTADGIALSFPVGWRRAGSSYSVGSAQRRFVAWSVVHRLEVESGRDLVRVVLRADAPLPPWLNGRVIDAGDPESGPVLEREVPGVDAVALQQAVLATSPGTSVRTS